MITRNHDVNVFCQAVSIASLYTQNAQRFDRASGGTLPRYLLLPVAGGSDGLTITFYARANQPHEGYCWYLDAQQVAPEFWLDAYARGAGVEVFINSQFISAGPFTYFQDNVWKLWVYRTTENNPIFQAGMVSLNAQRDSSHVPISTSLADIRVYNRRLSDAEITSPLLPNDMQAYYTFAEQSGASVLDRRGTRHGQLYY